jgi:hypothetical protein
VVGPGSQGTRCEDRSVLAKVLLVLGLVLLPLGIGARWTHETLLTDDGYLDAVAPLAREPQIQAAVAEAVSATLITPQEAADLVPILPDDLVESVVQALLDRVDDAVVTALDSEEFVQVWTVANVELHASTIALLRGEPAGLELQDGDLVLDLQPVREEVRGILADRGVPVPSGSDRPGPYVVVAQDPPLAWLSRAYRVADPVLEWFVVLPVVLIGLGVVLAADRPRALRLAGLGLLLVAVAVALGWLLGLWLSSGAFSGSAFEGTGAVVYDALAAGLLRSALWTAVIGAVAALAGWGWGNMRARSIVTPANDLR